METKNKKAYLSYVIIAILVLVIVYCFLKRDSSDLPENLSSWQAVFLADGQVYFGHLEEHNKSFFLLRNVYYLKYGNTIQQTKGNTGTENSAQNLNLIKLGGEVHGPEDSMYIDKDQIVFIENLKDTSQVVQAMKAR